MPDTPSTDPHTAYVANHTDDVQRLLALAPQDRPQWLRNLIGGGTPATPAISLVSRGVRATVRLGKWTGKVQNQRPPARSNPAKMDWLVH